MGAAAKDHHIGHASCPLCGSEKAVIGLSKSRLAYLVCNTCNAQTFARSGRSDELIRGLYRGPIGAKDEPPPEPTSSTPPIEPKAPTPMPAAPPRPRAAPREEEPTGWGVLG